MSLKYSIYNEHKYFKLQNVKLLLWLKKLIYGRQMVWRHNEYKFVLLSINNRQRHLTLFDFGHNRERRGHLRGIFLIFKAE